MSRISDSIYYTLLSDGCSREKAAQSARSLNDPLLYNRFDFYPTISSTAGCEAMHLFPCGTVRGMQNYLDDWSGYSNYLSSTMQSLRENIILKELENRVVEDEC